MASGQNVTPTLQAGAFVPSSTNPCTSLVNNNQYVLQYIDTTTDQSAEAAFDLQRNYAGGGVTIRIAWSAATATTGAVVWSAAIERQAAGGTAYTTDSFATAVNSSAATTNASAGVETYTTIGLTNGAQMDSLAAGEHARIRIIRVQSAAGDNMSGLANLHSVEIIET
ncbi:MAG TPA: hypothetical protein VIU64_18620 [Polyangia bacterium]